jgi:hypothetical protein
MTLIKMTLRMTILTITTFCLMKDTLSTTTLRGWETMKRYFTQHYVTQHYATQHYATEQRDSLRQAGNTKGGSITVPLTSCLTGLD